MRIQCTTKFDCTATGITGHFRASQLPFHDRAGNHIIDHDTWITSRNQQRNWETLLQIISLRCLPEEITDPRSQGDVWSFSFWVSTPGVFGDNDFSALCRDCQGVPMVLDPATGKTSLLDTAGVAANIWFSTVNN